MPQAVTTLGTIVNRVQNRVADTTTDNWDHTDPADSGWSNAVNDATIDILSDIIRFNALSLCDELHDSTTITLVANQEDYNYITAITADAKTYYTFIAAIWGEANVRVLPWYMYTKLLNSGNIYTSVNRPCMIFWGDSNFKLRPKPPNADATGFIFYYLTPPTTLDADAEKPDLDEKCIPLYEPKVAAKYWRRRRRYELMQMEEQEYEKLVHKIIKPHKVYKMHNILSTGNW